MLVLYLVIFALLVSAVVQAAPLLRRDSRLDEVARFRTARRITTSWTRPVADGPAGEG
jgi:hypothetical protein